MNVVIATNTEVTPHLLKDAPALIEHILPVQKLSAEAYKEQMAGNGKTLTALGSYWKGRKPLILNKACVLGCLLPATEDRKRDLQIFEMLMGMDDGSFSLRLGPRAAEHQTYRQRVEKAKRPEEVSERMHDHIWAAVNEHLGTKAASMQELVEQLGIMRFGHRPIVGDTFCGSGQIPFEAARIGCDVFASDLNPVACMLTWGAFNIVGGPPSQRDSLCAKQEKLVAAVRDRIDELGVEQDGSGWRAKVFIYCVEVRCPQTGWMVPLLPNLAVSTSRLIMAKLVPDPTNKRYNILIEKVSAEEFASAANGTVRTDGRGQEPYLIHAVEGVEYRTKISTLRGDYKNSDGSTANRVRMWDKSDIVPRTDDIFQERLYCIQWMRPKGKSDEYEFRTVTSEDLRREKIVIDYVAEHLPQWQESGWVPDMRIEPGDKTDEPIRTRGWTHWHHLFNPRQLLLGCLFNQYSDADLKFGFGRTINQNARLSRWDSAKGSDKVQGVFDNQALNTVYNYGTRGTVYAGDLVLANFKSFPLNAVHTAIKCQAADQLTDHCDIFVTDPPYGDAVKYEEIMEFFISWLRKNPPKQFAEWTWDSRRTLAIRGESEEFRRGMVSAYKRMTECMSDNGVQVIMFTHQSGSIWADMANIVWASGLQVTAAWYVVTETDSALRDGSYVKGTVLLVCRKRSGIHKTTRDDLAWEIQEEVQAQVAALTGLNHVAKGDAQLENLFEDADLQMAGYAAALRTLTRYSIIDGRDMTAEAVRPRVKGDVTFIDGLISFAVDTANQCLVPDGIQKSHWERLTGAERFYLKMLDMESHGAKTLDNYQNFAKAFKVRDFKPLLASHKANQARLKSSAEFGRAEMGEGSQLFESTLRAVLYALMELQKDMDGNEVIAHLALNVPDYYSDTTQRELVIELAGYLAKRLEQLRSEEASAARVLSELVKNQRLG